MITVTVTSRNIVFCAVLISFFGDAVAHLDDADIFLIFSIAENLPLGKPRTETEPHQSHTDGRDVEIVHFSILSNLKSSTWA